MSIKSKIEAHAASRLNLSARIAAIGDAKLNKFFEEETAALEELRAEALGKEAEPAEEKPEGEERRPSSARVRG